jgi:hypothetical protein
VITAAVAARLRPALRFANGEIRVGQRGVVHSDIASVDLISLIKRGNKDIQRGFFDLIDQRWYTIEEVAP